MRRTKEEEAVRRPAWGSVRKTWRMASAVWYRVAALSGASSIGLAAYGAHGLKLDPPLAKAFDNGNKMHLVHSGMLAMCPLLKRPHLTGSLFLGGIAVFSGSCYAAALTGDRANGKLAPFGGTALMLAWLSLAL